MLMLLATGVASAAPVAWTPFVQIDAFAHAQPVPVRAYVDDWNAPLDSGSDAVTHNRFELGVRRGPWSVSYVQHYDYEIKASPDAALFYHQTRNRSALTTGTVYALEVDAYHLRRQGLRVGYSHEQGSWTWSGGLSLLSGQKLLDGQLGGTATALGNKDYDYSAQVNYFYSRDELFERRVGAPAAKGYALDAGITGPLAPGVVLSLRVEDLWGAMHWSQAPVTSAVATSANKQFDSDGFVQYTPAVSGTERFADYVQRIHPQAHAEVDASFNARYSAGASARVTEVDWYPGLFLRRHLADEVHVTAEWLPAHGAGGLKFKYRQFGVGWASDRLKFDDARLLQLHLSAAYAFQ